MESTVTASSKANVAKRDRPSLRGAGSNDIPIPERFHCEAERRARRHGIRLDYENIGEELLALRKRAFDLYGARCLWSVPGHATISGMQGIAGGLQDYGDLAAARLAARILEKTGRNEILAP
ncbi:MAG: hypothetical protein F4103_10030 [Boseongicola sp. SB0673_bin_14]|nr:hypothetical protein [Boseongicola sp. SB0667_bin_21]MYI69047.1 hypothetical protein [Boseongicola sp. SB0673_bin_14]